MRFIQPTPTQLIALNAPLGTRLFYSCFVLLGGLGVSMPVAASPDEQQLQIFAYALIAFGLLMLFVRGRAIAWVFDKSNGSLVIKSRIFWVTQTSTHALAEIDKVQIERDNREEDSFGIEIVLVGGENLHLCPGYDLSYFIAEEGVRRISSFICDRDSHS